MTVSSGGGPEGSVTSPRSRAAAATVGVAAIAAAPVAAPAEANNLRRLKLSIWTPFDREPVAGTGPPSRARRACDNRCQPLRSTDQSGSAPANNYAQPSSSGSSIPPSPSRRGLPLRLRGSPPPKAQRTSLQVRLVRMVSATRSGQELLIVLKRSVLPFSSH